MIVMTICWVLALVALGVSLRTNHMLRQTIERIREAYQESDNERSRWQRKYYDEAERSEKLEYELDGAQGINPENHELIATYRSLGVEPPTHLLEWEDQQRKRSLEAMETMDGIMKDLDALDSE